MAAIKKFDLLDQKNNEVSYSDNKTTGSRVNFSTSFLKNRKTLVVLGILLVLILASVFTIVLPAVKTYRDARITYSQVKLTVDAVKKQNVVQASVELGKTRDDLTKTQNDLNSLAVLGFIPIANFYYSDAQHIVKAGFHGLDAANILIDSVKPYADLLGLKGQGSFVQGSAQQRIQTAVTTMGKVTPRIDDIAYNLALAKQEIDSVDPNHYPAIFGIGKARDSIVSIKNLTDNGVTFINEAKPVIKILPQLLGEPDSKKYLVLFQNDKELRPTGGFITAYSIFRLEHGIIHVDLSSDIYSLDATLYDKPSAPKPILDYLPEVPQFNIRDSNLSPDFVASMQTFTNMYQKAGAYQKVDGIIVVDTHALVAAMNILGDVYADGSLFTTKIEPTCNCAQVIYTLEQYSDERVGFVKENRKGIIGDLMYAILQKAFASSPKLYWGPLFQAMLSETNQKHVLFYVYDQQAQKGLEALNASGRIVPFDGDYLHINEANFGGAKSNMFISENVTQDYNIQSDGTITKTVTVDYKNPFPPSNCSLASVGLCLNAVLRDWIRVYVPKGSTLVDSKGSEVKLSSYDELGKTVFDGFLTVRPQGIAKFTITYRLPFKLASGSSLPLLIQKQPGTDNIGYITTLNGRQVDKFILLTDTKKTIKP